MTAAALPCQNSRLEFLSNTSHHPGACTTGVLPGVLPDDNLFKDKHTGPIPLDKHLTAGSLGKMSVYINT